MKSLLLFLAVPLCSHAFTIQSRPVSQGRGISSSKARTLTTTLHLVPLEHIVDTVASVAAATSQHYDLTLSSILVSLDVTAAPPETAGISYSKASYYTVLGLYLMSFPGIWSTVKRSTTAKIKRKTYVSPGEKSGAAKAMSLRQQAGEIMACT
jgi:Cofactor assembly of complex C subunit B